MRRKQKRITIGVLVGGILDDFTRIVCGGALRAAKQLDVNIAVIPGKYLDRDLSGNRELMYEYQFNTIFSYAEEENIDAILVMAGSIGCFTSTDEIKKMLSCYKVPCVLIASKIEGYTSVVYNNRAGVHEAMDYLITKVQAKRIGMIGGNNMNLDVMERKEAFFSALKEHGLPAGDELYIEGDLTRRGSKVFAEFLDRNPDLDAIFCVNDDTAIGLYEELRRRNIQPGKDISVFGFDDIVAAAKANPPIASIRADGGMLGEKALQMAVEMVKGEKVSSVTIPTRFVLRDSLCRPKEENRENTESMSDLTSMESSFEDVFWRINHEDFSGCMEELKESIELFLKSIIKETDSGDVFPDGKEVQKCMDRFLELGAVSYADMENMLVVFEKLHRMLKSRYKDTESRYVLERQFSLIYRKIIQAMDFENGKQRDEQQKDNYSMKFFVRDMLQFENGNDQNYALILNNLEWLHINNAFLYAFEEPTIHLFREKFHAPKYLYLKAARKDGKVSSVPVTEQKTSIRKILDNKYVQFDGKYSLVQLPLFCNEMLYGVLLCDLTEEIFVNGEFLVNQMSSAMRMINLLKTNEQIQQQLEESFEAMRENNVVLDALSKSDGLTGILNRRGFYMEAEKMLETAKEKDESLLVFYADMNNLKIINDRYGHEEGDFSLKLIGGLLDEKLRDRGIIGRIGGDEFAGMIQYKKGDGGESVLKTLYRAFEIFNGSSDKEYNITVSIGAVEIEAGQTLTLEEALANADEKLYEVKKFRKKEVAKNKG